MKHEKHFARVEWELADVENVFDQYNLELTPERVQAAYEACLVREEEIVEAIIEAGLEKIYAICLEV